MRSGIPNSTFWRRVDSTGTEGAWSLAGKGSAAWTPVARPRYPARVGSDLFRTAAKGGVSVAEVARRFWWPVYGSVRDDGLSPQTSAVLVSRLLARLANGSPLLRHEDHDGRLRRVVQAELMAVRTLAGPMVGELDGSVEATVNIGWAESRDAYGTGIQESDPFRRRWGTVILELALTALRTRAQEADAGERVEPLLPYLSRRVPDWRITDIDAAVDSSDVDNLRDEFRAQVRRVVSDTVTTPTSLEAELVDLFG
jgi:hypothetical protein